MSTAARCSLVVGACLFLVHPSLLGPQQVGARDLSAQLVYRLDVAPSAMIANPEKMQMLANVVEQRSAMILASGAIDDEALQREIFASRRAAALVLGKLADAARFDRAATSSTTGTLGADLLIAALEAAGKATKSARPEAIRHAIRGRLNLRTAEHRGEVIALRRELALASSAFRMGEISGFADPEWQRNPEVRQEFAHGMLRLWIEINLRNPHLAIYESELDRWLSRHPEGANSIWAQRGAPDNWREEHPVTIAVWDGVDREQFAHLLKGEAGDPANGKDDDSDGFVDEFEGLGFDEHFSPTSQMLTPVSASIAQSVPSYERYMRGLGELSVGLDSADVNFARTWRRSLSAAGVVAFEKGYGHYSQYSHGTRVADVAVRGLTKATLVPVRISFAYESPGPVLDEAAAQRFVAMVETGTRYMRHRGVRVCNISWGFTVRDIEDNLNQHGLERDAAQRSRRARAIFGTMQAGMARAIKQSPDILFVVSAGNAGQNIDYAGDLPGTINLPNVLTVGAADEQGRLASFASTGASVDLYALGTNVDAMVPGGGRLRSSGASLAAPQVVNAAARLLNMRPNLTTAELASILVKSAKPAPNAELPLLHVVAALELMSKQRKAASHFRIDHAIRPMWSQLQ